MSIEAFEIPTEPVMHRGKEIFRVRGMNVEDLTFLVTNYMQDIRDAIIDYGKSRTRVVAKQGLNEFVLLAAKNFPGLSAEIISRAADEPGQTDKARSLPFMVQIMALRSVLMLSTEEAGGLKNLMAVLAAAIEMDQPGAKKLGEIATHLQSIIGDSVKMSASSSATGTLEPIDTL